MTSTELLPASQELATPAARGADAPRGLFELWISVLSANGRFLGQKSASNMSAGEPDVLGHFIFPVPSLIEFSGKTLSLIASLLVCKSLFQFLYLLGEILYPWACL